jgi:hypothetical protein
MRKPAAHLPLAPLTPALPSSGRAQAATFRAFLGSTAVTVTAVLYMRRTLLATASPDWRPLPIAAYVYPLVALHDAWFYAVHWAMHRSRTLYRRVHYQHHVREGDLTVFGSWRVPAAPPAPVAALPAGLLAPCPGTPLQGLAMQRTSRASALSQPRDPLPPPWPWPPAGTADMHALEAFLLTMGFYGALLAVEALWLGTWNPVS